MKKPSRRTEPLPKDLLGQKLCLTFPYRWRAILKQNELEASWETLTRYAIRPRELWNLWQDPGQIVGVRFGSKTSYALLDIDKLSPYHPDQSPESLDLIRAALETIGITRTLLVQSSDSTGLHLFIPLNQEVPTFWLAAALKQVLETHDFLLVQGTLESFPNCKAYSLPGKFTEYHGHRLPLQPASGSYLLDDDRQIIHQDLNRFFGQWECCADQQDIEQLLRSIRHAKRNFKRRRQRRGAIAAAAWKKALEVEIGEGWTSHGQTNSLLKSIACHGVVFEQLQGEALVEYVTRIAVSRPGYQQWCRHQRDINVRCLAWSRSAEQYYWSMGSPPKRSGQLHKLLQPIAQCLNQLRSEEAQARIRLAVQHLEESHQLPEQISRREALLVQQAHCSKQTLRKYMSLWHPKHRLMVCTTPPDLPLTVIETKPAFASEPLQPKQEAEVHTQPLMKGVTCQNEAGLEKIKSLGCLGFSGQPAELNDLIKAIAKSKTISLQPKTNGFMLSGSQDSVIVGTSAPLAPTASTDHKWGADGIRFQTVGTGEPQSENKVCQSTDSTILAKGSEPALDQPRSPATSTDPHLTAYLQKMRGWLESKDFILVKEAELWFAGQAQYSMQV